MSNWALVIVNWSSVDAIADKHGHLNRARFLAGGLPFQYVAPCGPDSMGGTCEVAVVLHVNHFAMDHEIVQRLRSLEWEYPEQVAVIYKAEEDDLPRVCRVFEDSDGADEVKEAGR